MDYDSLPMFSKIRVGTGIVIEATDYVLMHNSLEDVITATDLSRKSK
jgi:Cu+-exporting ATPase